jgi:hypothetical protein
MGKGIICILRYKHYKVKLILSTSQD